MFDRIIAILQEEKRDEMTRQCNMAWRRGCQFGLLIGLFVAVIVNISLFVIVLIK